MKLALLFIIFIVSIQGYNNQQDLVQNNKNKQKQLIDNALSNTKISNMQFQLNKIHQTYIHIGQLYLFYTNYSSLQRININLYSKDVQFGFLYNTYVIDEDLNKTNIESNQHHKQDLNQNISLFGKDILSKTSLLNKLKLNTEYKHFLDFQSQGNLFQQNKNNSKQSKILILAVYIPTHKISQKSLQIQNRTFNLNIIVTTNTTQIDKNSLQKYTQYKLINNQTHLFSLRANEIFSSEKQKFIGNKNKQLVQEQDQFFMFHTLHIVGDFQYNVSIKSYYKKYPQIFQISLIQTNCSQSTFQFNQSLLKYPKQQFYLSSNEKTEQHEQRQVQIMFQVRCISSSCTFITQIEKSQLIRTVIPGIPCIYSINQVQIFELSNPFDLDIFIDMSKKNGFSQYQICSTKNNKIIHEKDNICLQQLRNPTSTIHMFQVKQKDDKLHSLGRNNEIVINSQHQSYCFQCSYYLALYAQYDNVMGMITFKNSLSATIIPQGNSITKVLKRNQSDEYLVYGLNSRLLFQRFSGKYEVYFQQINLQQIHNIDEVNTSLQQNKKIHIGQLLKMNEQNYYSIDLKDQIQAFYSDMNKQSLSYRKIKNNQNKVYKLFIQTQNNYPSTYYSMIVVNDDSRKIILKDGVPFFNKQKNKVSVFKYLTQNLATQSFGTIIINSNQISQIQLQIYGNCLTLQQTQQSIKTYKMEKQDESTLNLLKNRIKLYNSSTKKKYQLQKIQNKKINLMANRIDIIIEPQMCKSYIIKMINNATQSFITYEILVSFIDSIILPLNSQVPGILQYPGKIIQIYEVFVPQKSNLSILINFCRSAKSRMEIYRNKEALFTQNSDQKVIFNSESQLQEIIYLAHSGVFYITIQFFGFSSILEYTILVKQYQVEQGFYYIDLSKQQQEIEYGVKQGRFFSTTYKLYFSPIFLKHWSKDVQRDVEYFETNYFILESNSYPLLKRASNCKGQFFSDIVNHHEHFKQVKLDKNKLIFYSPQKQGQGQLQFSHAFHYQRGFYSYEYQTNNPLSFLIIVPVISKSTSSNQLSVIPYWQFNKKSRQPYQITQLYNGKVYSIFQHWFVSFVIWMQQVVDFHIYQSFIVMLLVICSCLPVTCCLLICIYRTKVNIEYYCNLLYAKVQEFFQKRVQSQLEIRQRQRRQAQMNRQIVAIPSEQNEAFSQGNIDMEDSNLEFETQLQNQIISRPQRQFSLRDKQNQILSQDEQQSLSAQNIPSNHLINVQMNQNDGNQN